MIIPAYNASSSIIACLESVLMQTYPVKEIIIVDDGSGDDTFCKLEEYKQYHHLTNLFIVRQSNSGPSVARNKGISLAKGEWIAFLDADDRWMPDKLELQVRCLGHNPQLTVIGCRPGGDGKKGDCILLSFNCMLLKNYFVTSSVLLKKAILPDVPFDVNRRYSEDYKLWLELAFHHSCAVLTQTVVIYANNENRFTRNSLSAHMWEMEKGELKNYRYCLEKKYIEKPCYCFLVVWSLVKFIVRKFCIH